MPTPGPDPAQLDLALSWLGYPGHPGWVTADALASVSGCRNVLRQAFEEMSVVGCFGIPQASRQGGTREFLPVVYVATASDEEGERILHRLAWSQGTVPFLVIVTPEGIRSCDVTRYAPRDWKKDNPCKPWGPSARSGDPSLPDDLTSAEHLAAIRLSVSIGLGPARKAGGSGRVDKLLLDGLRTLGRELTGKGPNGGLPVATANRLLSCCLYLYCLADRGVLTQEMIAGRGHDGISLDGREEWSVSAFECLMRDLEAVFNGGVFHFPAEAMTLVGVHHLALVRGVLKRGDTLRDTQTQLSFLDIDLSVLRTETLSSVYEMLFENQGAGQRKKDGAFYTPAYLVDYVLAQVERTCPILPGRKVVDCAAGSGVFLVGAFRRMLERTLEETGCSRIPLARSREILSECIFGIERNEDAANVAAFSLFLTMLDYARPGAWPVAEAGGTGRTVFPALIGRTILVRDLFEEEPLPPTFPSGFDVLVGNPPWQKVKVIGRKAEKAMARLSRTRGGCVDRDRAGELFFWTGHDRFLRPGGTFGMVLSAKSFLSAGANAFPSAVLATTTLTGLANLTHLRRKLFQGAEHPAVAAFGVKRQPAAGDPVWIHYPLLASLPLDGSGTPWCLVRDAADVDVHANVDFGRPEGVFRSLMLRPVDRRMVEYLDDACASGKASALEDLCGKGGLYLGRGGSPAMTKLPDGKLLGTRKENNWIVRLGLRKPEVVLEDGRKAQAAPSEAYVFDEDDLRKTKFPFSSLFAGDIVVIPRSLKNIAFVERMFGFNSSLIGLCFRRDGSPLDDARRDFLKAMSAYLGSGFARYAAALYGRMWMVDRRRFEAGDMARLPVPFRPGDHQRVAAILSAARKGTLDAEILHQLGIQGELAAAVREYGSFRSGFENGILPKAAHVAPDTVSRDDYIATLASELGRSFTSTWRVDVDRTFDAARTIHVITASFVKAADPERRTTGIASPATVPSPATWGDSLGIAYDAASRRVVVSKPDILWRWTREQAVSDGRRILASIRQGGIAA